MMAEDSTPQRGRLNSASVKRDGPFGASKSLDACVPGASAPGYSRRPLRGEEEASPSARGSCSCRAGLQQPPLSIPRLRLKILRALPRKRQNLRVAAEGMSWHDNRLHQPEHQEDVIARLHHLQDGPPTDK